MDTTFLTNVIASGSAALVSYIGGFISIITGLGPYIIGMIALSVIVTFIVRALGWGKKVGRRGH